MGGERLAGQGSPHFRVESGGAGGEAGLHRRGRGRRRSRGLFSSSFSSSTSTKPGLVESELLRLRQAEPLEHRGAFGPDINGPRGFQLQSGPVSKRSKDSCCLLEFPRRLFEPCVCRGPFRNSQSRLRQRSSYIKKHRGLFEMNRRSLVFLRSTKGITPSERDLALVISRTDREPTFDKAQSTVVFSKCSSQVRQRTPQPSSVASQRLQGRQVVPQVGLARRASERRRGVASDGSL